MRVRSYIYNGDTAPDHVETVLERLAARDEDLEYRNIAAADDRADAVREAMFSVRESVRIGTNPEAIYDDNGTPDFSAGVLITQEPTGRRNLYVGREALEALSDGEE
ncbi:hypothetical protein [Natronorubrum halophilum]|uniref:hypothetical protein n=1 Tax=Natronorubrum halophilum TaxID=1702106 RepID=UPI000EF6AEBA|nr:hypothetical protein [Natronorubrum halophilum]